MTVTITKNMFGSGLYWQPKKRNGNGKKYFTSPEHIFPLRHRNTILALLNSQKTIVFGWWEYDKTNKLLFVENLQTRK